MAQLLTTTHWACRSGWTNPPRLVDRATKGDKSPCPSARSDDALRGGSKAASFHLSYAHWQAYICPSSSLVIVPTLSRVDF